MEERLVQRFDARSIRERFDSAKAMGLVSTPPAGAPRNAQTNAVKDADALPNVIIGDRNPELFLPHELYVRLVFASIVEDRYKYYRDQAGEKIAVILNVDDFWRELEAASAPYSALLRREQELAQRLNAAGSEERPALLQQIRAVQEPQCAARADALAAAVKAIGRRSLYRVLYEVVAPTMATTTYGDETATQANFVAGGCR